MKQQIIIATFLLVFCSLFSVAQRNTDFLILFDDTIDDEQGYKNQNGEIIIPAGKYDYCFTDTFKTYAIILKGKDGFFAIDRNENILYEVFPFDNGPDYTSEGLFRIIMNNKIGYADSLTGKIIITPQFDCAFPFEKGIAEVSNNCTTKPDGEHEIWLSDNWFFIDKMGRKTIKAK